MEFLITRTSDWNGKQMPTEGCVKKEGNWYITINSLEDLVKLTEKEGEIIINQDILEIYDDYRE